MFNNTMEDLLDSVSKELSNVSSYVSLDELKLRCKQFRSHGVILSTCQQSRVSFHEPEIPFEAN